MMSRMTSFAYTPGRSEPLTVMRRTFSGSIARHCEASTSRTCEVPMPNAIAPNAPCVDVWLSPHAIVMPGCVRPELGSDDMDDALVGAVDVVERDAELAAVLLERRHHFLGEHVEKRPALVERRHDVIDGRERAVRKRHLAAAHPQHVERLRARHFVDEVQADEQLRLPGRQRAHGVLVPDFLKKCLSHEIMVKL